MGGVANILLMGPFNPGKPAVQRVNDLSTFVNAEGGLGHIGKVVKIFHLKIFYIHNRGNQMDLIGSLPQGPYDFRVSRMPNQN